MSFLQIASWNIEHLSGQSRATKKQSAYALADHIEMAGIDLIALQEVYVTPSDEEVRLFDNQPLIESRAVTERRNSDLDVVCFLLEEHLNVKWSYVILPNRKSGDRSQLCTVLWNTERLTVGDIFPLNVKHKDGDYNLWDRKPHLLHFTSEIDAWRRNSAGEWEKQAEKRTISIVPLHMKSNYGGVTKNRIVRGKEAQTLCDALDEIKDTIDPSLILLGDTNVLRNDEPAIEAFVTRGFIDLNNNDSATYWSKQYNEAPFDRIFVSEERPEFKYSRQYVLRSSDLEQHDRFLSDHYMIKISVKNYVDDADPR
ncbi:endonuclease/exonuclease/phosphatase family protein [uncultured Psychroserpens sp.]|uniref:endonuclease/exonuclease/phosphatase family protein n=1 Tax=uncultured Psychroserpens sp. TaxID=255436 RepID=UPI00262FFB73|nr:endonuclease/exonuclease/phosphatase family protein [uncultured Psychroserpens sp.]